MKNVGFLENEIIYGLQNLDQAIAFEARRNNLKIPDKIKQEIAYRKRLKALKKKDPFIYK